MSSVAVLPFAVAAVMTPEPHSVQPHQTLNDAAQLMWERDCGWLPVTEHGGHVVGVLTDRDVCMAAYTRGRSLDELAVAGTMCTDLQSCRADDGVDVAESKMRIYRVRRLPVVDDQGVLVGVLSITDLVRKGAIAAEDAIATLAAIAEPRSAIPYV
jgi:CBS domain-containing protein